MSITNAARRCVASLATFAASIAVLSAGPSLAAAQSIHACVKPGSGATRIVTAKAKCHKGENKLAWNVSGPRGATGAQGVAGTPGAQGTAGAPGTNGEGALFGASVEEDEFMRSEVPLTVIQKVVPPGSFLVSAKTVMEGLATTNLVPLVDASCELRDDPGTAGAQAGEALDHELWQAVPGEGHSHGEALFEATSTLTFEASFSSGVTSTLSVVCETSNSEANAVVTPIDSQLHALSVSSIG